METNIPKALVLRTTDRQFTIKCPYCDEEHLHGKAGGLGYRVAHCNPAKQYEIVDERY